MASTVLWMAFTLRFVTENIDWVAKWVGGTVAVLVFAMVFALVVALILK
jgi:hypothetical protein